MKYKWTKSYIKIDSDKIDFLYNECKKNNFPLKKSQIILLLSRGLETYQEIVQFLKEYSTFSPHDFFDPLLLPDMKKALQRLKLAHDKAEGILIFGDYDADGITSTTILYKFFKTYFPNSPLCFYQPSRFNEGYGFNEEGVDFALKHSLSLIITVGCGISSHKAIDYANQNKIDVIVTDHHESPQELPKALALIDPKRKDTTLSFTEWAGVGVAFNVILGFALTYPDICPNFKMAPYLEIVAIGTIADIVPVIGENRTIVKAGFFILDRDFESHQGINLGLYQLRSVANILNTSMQSYSVSFAIAPRLNAASRMEEAKIATTLLISEDNNETYELAKKLNRLNEARKKKQDELYKKIETYYKTHPEETTAHILLYADTDVDEGVRGIVASKIVNKFNKPTIILSIDNKTKMISGSGRSVPNINLHQFLMQFQDLFEQWGGHSQAIGLSIKTETYHKFKSLIIQKSMEEFSPTDLEPTIEVDTIIEPEDLNEEYINFVKKMEPFGVGNSKPKFLLQNMKINKIQSFTFFRKTGNKMNLRAVFTLESLDNLFKINLTMWSPDEFFEEKNITDEYLSQYEYKIADFIITLSSSTTKGRTYLNYTIVDFKIKE